MMRDRIRPPRGELEQLLNSLKEKGVFETKQKGIMFAAALGYALDPSSGGEEMGSVGEAVKLQQFRKPQDEGFIDALAVAATEELDVLSTERHDERLDIFERYMHAGLKEIDRRLKREKSRDELEIICEILDTMGGLEAEDPENKVKQLMGLV